MGRFALAPALAMVSVLLFGSAASAAETEGRHHQGDAAPACTDSGLACATAATPLFTRDGALWLVWGAAGQVSVAKSADLGRSFGKPVLLSPQPDRLDAGGDGRPVLTEDSRGRLVAAYAVFTDDAWNARIMVSRSTDGGASFSPPRPITDDPTSQRFPTLASDGHGGIFAAWIDKRTVAAARAAGQSKIGAALAYAWSEDGGESFQTSRIFHDGSCECCRLGLIMDAQGRPSVMFRSLFDGGVRDHALVVFADPSTPRPAARVSVDNWAINGCPHHGPSLALGPTGSYHAAWFTQGPIRQGLFYARSTDGGATFSTPMRLGVPERHPARPAVLAADGAIWLAWKEFDGQTTTVWTQWSGDDGRSWSTPRLTAQTAGSSDHPLLASDGRNAYLSWLTRAEGYRLLPLEATP